jgi:hypothetical protein
MLSDQLVVLLAACLEVGHLHCDQRCFLRQYLSAELERTDRGVKFLYFLLEQGVLLFHSRPVSLCGGYSDVEFVELELESGAFCVETAFVVEHPGLCLVFQLLDESFLAVDGVVAEEDVVVLGEDDALLGLQLQLELVAEFVRPALCQLQLLPQSAHRLLVQGAPLCHQFLQGVAVSHERGDSVFLDLVLAFEVVALLADVGEVQVLLL